TAEMGQFLMASCLKPVPSTPIERLDAGGGRLTPPVFAAPAGQPPPHHFFKQPGRQPATEICPAGGEISPLHSGAGPKGRSPESRAARRPSSRAAHGPRNDIVPTSRT